MPGLMLSAYVDDLDAAEARAVLQFAHGMALPYADDDARQRMIDRAYPEQARQREAFVWRFQGQPVTLETLKTSLGLHWGQGFEAA